ncbi:bifunctional metallophosphatase/5'-nucleotidase [Haloferula sargassicola]|uniref:Trifunctional nucleotide phosphoesterase protein YfkN n=1 Tax=Haloferula sargassicola TaxID=490096 RepID=A0ABP9UME9_9BACT
MDLTRREWLLAGGAWLGATSLGWGNPSRRVKTVSIFFTTDLHGHIEPTQTYDGIGDVGGMARCVTQIREWKRQNPDSLLVDIGDVYQGTAVGLETDGTVMIDLFNRLGYDAWTIGNHDLDWGRGVIEGALDRSTSAILTGNLTVDGRASDDASGPWKKVKPWMIKEVAGFRIGLIGVTTPGMPFWLAPETLDGVAVSDPAVCLKRSIAELRAQKVDAVVALGHMGWRFEDDFANPVRTMLSAAPGVDVYLAGHSHRDEPSFKVGETLCSQANYFGIHCGRVDLAFDAESRRLIDKRAFTVLMDSRFELDPAVMEAARPELRRADEQLARKVCEVSSPLPETGARSLRSLLCAAFAGALEKAGMPVDAVFHGTFGTGPVQAGDKTVRDCWEWLPYENLLVTAELTPLEIAAIVEEGSEQSDRDLWPMEVQRNGDGRIEAILHGGRALEPGRRYRVALNSYDGQSGGRSMMKAREILFRPESKRELTGVATRDALIEYLLEKGTI